MVLPASRTDLRYYQYNSNRACSAAPAQWFYTLRWTHHHGPEGKDTRPRCCAGECFLLSGLSQCQVGVHRSSLYPQRSRLDPKASRTCCLERSRSAGSSVVMFGLFQCRPGHIHIQLDRDIYTGKRATFCMKNPLPRTTGPWRHRLFFAFPNHIGRSLCVSQTVRYAWCAIGAS